MLHKYFQTKSLFFGLLKKKIKILTRAKNHIELSKMLENDIFIQKRRKITPSKIKQKLNWDKNQNYENFLVIIFHLSTNFGAILWMTNNTVSFLVDIRCSLTGWCLWNYIFGQKTDFQLNPLRNEPSRPMVGFADVIIFILIYFQPLYPINKITTNSFPVVEYVLIPPA